MTLRVGQETMKGSVVKMRSHHHNGKVSDHGKKPSMPLEKPLQRFSPLASKEDLQCEANSVMLSNTNNSNKRILWYLRSLTERGNSTSTENNLLSCPSSEANLQVAVSLHSPSIICSLFDYQPQTLLALSCPLWFITNAH